MDQEQQTSEQHKPHTLINTDIVSLRSYWFVEINSHGLERHKNAWRWRWRWRWRWWSWCWWSSGKLLKRNEKNLHLEWVYVFSLVDYSTTFFFSNMFDKVNNYLVTLNTFIPNNNNNNNIQQHCSHIDFQWEFQFWHLTFSHWPIFTKISHIFRMKFIAQPFWK